MARSKNTRHLRARMPTADPAALPPRDFVEALTLPLQQTLAAVRWLDGRVRNRPKLEEQTLEKAALTDADCVAQEILLVALRQFYRTSRSRARRTRPPPPSSPATNPPTRW